MGRPRLAPTLAGLVAAMSLLCAPAHAQSREFILKPKGEWTKVREPQPGSAEAIIAQARVQISKGETSEARRALDAFIEDEANATSEYLPEAYLLRGDAKLARGREENALRDYEVVIKEHIGSEVFVSALEREHAIGKAYLNGLKRRLFWMRIDSGEALGQEILIRVCQRLPGSRLAEQSLMDLLDFYYRKPDLKAAAECCRIYLGWVRKDDGALSDLAGLTELSRPKGRHEMFAKMRLIQASVLQFRGPRYNAAPLEDAKLLIDQFAAEYPNEAERTGIGDAMSARVDELLAMQMLETSRWYMRRGDEPSARYTLRKLARKFPQTVASSDALNILREKGWGMGKGASLKQTNRPTAPAPDQPAATEVPASPITPATAPAPATDDDAKAGTP